MFEFAKDALLYDLLANDASLATAQQLSLAYREGLHNCTAVWSIFVAIPTAIPDDPFTNNSGILAGNTVGSCNLSS